MAGKNDVEARAYARRAADETVLFQAVNEHLDGFAQKTRGLVLYAKAKLGRYLDCGILANGFA